MNPRRLLRTIAIGIAFIVLLTLLLKIGNAQTTSTSQRTPVLVELFTSEGCSSCPPADTLLAKLSEEQPVQAADIIALSEHVDYWDKDGWHDRFSSAELTERQREYGTIFKVPDVYTPQIVIDGTQQFVGTDVPHTLSAIEHEAQTAKLNLTLSKPVLDGNRVSASISTTSPAEQLKGDLYAALVDPVDSTDVLKGENKGHHLQHVDVVRTLERVGSLKDLRSGTHTFTLSAPKDSTPGSMHLVVFAQRSGSGPILGAVSTTVTQ